MNAGTDLARDIQTGFLNRLSLTPVRGVALDHRPARRRRRRRARPGDGLHRRRLRRRRAPGLRRRRRGHAAPASPSRSRSPSARVGPSWRSAPARARRSRGSSRCCSSSCSISSMNFPRNLIEADWFRWAATVNPVSYLIEGIRSLIIEGWNGEALGARLRDHRRRCWSGALALSLVRPPREDDPHVTRDFRNVAFAVGWRTIHNVLHNPSLLFPGLIFPLLNFAAFAGGLSRLRHLDGLRLRARLRGLPVLLRAAPVGRVRRRLHRLRDRARLRVRLLAAADARRRAAQRDHRRLRDRRAHALDPDPP